MSLNRPVKDEDILDGFASLHQAMATGFDRVHSELAEVRAEMATGFTDVRREAAQFEHRVFRRFDQIDERLDGHERRLEALERR